MDTKNIATIVITFIIVFTISYYIIGAAWPTEKTIKSLRHIGRKGRNGAYDLARAQSVAPSDMFAEPYFSGGGGTLVFYLYIKSIPRTVDIQTEFTDIVGVPGSISLQVSQESSRIQIFTQASIGTAVTEEHISLPKLPQQKWVQVAILREGRRIDVIYNKKTVASQRLRYVPIVRKNALMVGSPSPSLLGIAGNFRVASRRLSVREILQEYSATSDTRGKPYIGIEVPNSSLTNICAGPSCNSAATTTTTPQNTLQFWSSPYR